MNAISLYVSASRLLFNQSDTENPNYSDLYRLVPYLRQSLSCTVCANLLVEPYTAENSICQHHVCRTCIGGRKNLKPTCSSCKNYHNYHANTQLRILLQCYKSLCSYILATPSVYNSMHNYVHVDAFSNGNNEAHNLSQLIDEGAQFRGDDEYKSNSGLPKSKISILPCIFTTTSSISTTGHTNQSSIATNKIITNNKTTFNSSTTAETPLVHGSTKQPNCTTSMSSVSRPRDSLLPVSTQANLTKTTPIRTVSNGTALYSVLYTGTGNKITIKRKTDDNNHIFTTANTMSTKDVLNILSRNPAKITQHPQIQQIHAQKPIKPAVPHPQLIQTQSQPHQQAQPQPQVSGLITTQSSNFKKPAIKILQKRKGCRCGNATPTPGKLTCCGQRCPCYVESKSCIDCKCRGCRNPHRIDGLKVRNNNRFIDIQTKYKFEIPFHSSGTATTSTSPIDNLLSTNEQSNFREKLCRYANRFF